MIKFYYRTTKRKLPLPTAQYSNGRWHRAQAVILTAYYCNRQLHRENDPAIIWSDGHLEWYANGMFIRSERID